MGGGRRMFPAHTRLSALTPRTAAGFLLLLALGFFGNYYSLPLFFGVDFLFGSSATLLIVCLFGIWAGLGAAVLASLYTYFLWGHPWAIVIFAAEAVVVGLLYHRGRRNLILSNGIFWLVIGMPLVALFYGGIMRMESAATILIMLKQSVNGMFNALVASIALLVILGSRGTSRPLARVPLYVLLFILVTGMVFIPALVLTVLASHQVIRGIEKEAEERLDRNGTSLVSEVHLWFDTHFNAVEDLADSIWSERLAADIEPQARLIRSVFPEFRQILITDADGTVAAASPESGLAGADLTGQSIGDRGFYRRARSAGGRVALPFREGLRDPGLHILAVPVGENGEEGLVLGVLDLSYITELLRDHSYARAVTTVLISQESPFIAVSDEQDPAALLAKRRLPTITGQAEDIFLLAPEDRSLPRMSQWQNSYYGREIPFENVTHWRLLVLVPVAPFQALLYERYIFNLGLALILTYLALVVAAFIGRTLSGPIRQLADITAGLPQQLATPLHRIWPRSQVAEVQALVENFDTMTLALQRNFAEIENRRNDLEREVLERQRVEADLQQRERELHSVLENAPDIIARFDREGRHLYVNSAFQRLIDLNPEDVKGKTCRQLRLPEEICGLWEEEIRLVFDEGRERVFEFTFAGATGPLFFQTRLVPELGESGRAETLLGMTRDITSRKDAENMVTEQNQVLQMLASGSPLFDVLGALVQMMDTRSPETICSVLLWREETGTLHQAIESKLPAEFAGEIEGMRPGPLAAACGTAIFLRKPVLATDIQSDPRWEKYRAVALRHGLAACWSVPILSSSGEPLGTFATYFPKPTEREETLLRWLEGAAHIAGIAMEQARAMDALHRAEEELRTYATDLEKRVADRTNELQESNHSLESFCYTIAHDLRAPLRSIQGFSTALCSDYAEQLGGEAEFFLQRIQGAAVRMDVLIRDLLAWGRLSHSNLILEPIPVDDVLQNALQQLGSEIEERRAEVKVDAPLGSVIASGVILEQILMNLLTNALKYVKPDESPRIRIWTEKVGENRLRLLIEDNGIGIEPQHHQRIFQVFERLESARDYTGTGIGLAIVSKAADRLGGRVGLTSDPKKGSCFWIDLPKAASRAVAG